MKIFVLLLIASFSAVKMSFWYTIESFIIHMVEEGIYRLIKEIKKEFGREIGTEVCLELYQSNDCEKVVNNYMDENAPDEPVEPVLGDSTPLKSFYGNFFNIPLIQRQQNFQLLQFKLFSYAGHLKSRRDIEKIAWKIKMKYNLIFA